MVNPEHISILKQGELAYRSWRSNHPKETLDLTHADLTNNNLNFPNLSNINFLKAKLNKCNFNFAHLSDIVFDGASLIEANFGFSSLFDVSMKDTNLSNASFRCSTIYRGELINSNLSRSKLDGLNTYSTNFSKADLSEADLSFANFIEPDFNETNLKKSTLNHFNIISAELKDTDLSESKMSNTSISFSDLSRCLGLNTITHDGPSSVCIYTIIRTFRNSNNNLTPEIANFLISVGIPQEIVNDFPRLISAAEYHTCFICYGKPDTKFAEELVRDLRARGISCWLYSLDYKVGERTWREITHKRREADKMIVLCSLKSLMRAGVKREIEEQITEEEDKIIPISLDNDWELDHFEVKTGTMDLKPFLLDRNYADFSDESKYHKSLERLLKGLRR